MEGIGARFALGKLFGSPSEGGENAMDKLAQRMLQTQDVDESGDLTLEETKLSQEGFNNVDRNSDGRITREEIAEGLEEKKGDLVTILKERGEEIETYGPSGKVRAMTAHVMHQLDADKSHSLDQTETNLTDDEFSAVDTDGDGVLSADEIAAAIRNRMEEAEVFLEEITRPDTEEAKARSKEAIQNLTTNLMEELDEDNSGDINQDESTLSDELFSKIDTNGDGVLSSEEIAAALRNQPEAAREFLINVFGEGNIPGLPENWIDRMAQGLMQAFDVDNSGDLTAEESGLEAEAFEAMDADGDGIISGEELAGAIKDRSEATRDMVEEVREREPHRDPIIRRAMASYRGNMDDLMAQVFNPNMESES